MINARAETLAEKPAYRPLLATGRCLILADGFYEWRLDPDGKKRPVRYTLEDGAPFGFAGLWTIWRDPESDEPLLHLHDHHDDGERARRTGPRPHAGDPPARRARTLWLDRDVPAGDALALLQPYPRRANDRSRRLARS